MKLENKVTIITGGGTGIGLACAKLFCSEGAKVILFGRRQEPLDDAVAVIGENSLGVSGDITQTKDISKLVQITLERFGQIDILINNAGTFTGAPLHEMAEDRWDEIININLRGVFLMTKKVLPYMVEQKSGNIIHISSILGIIAAPQTAAYNTSKAAVIQFSRSIAVEYGTMGIRSNSVCPGLIATEMTADLLSDKELMKEWSKNYPIGRFGKPEDIAHACLYLASDFASFVTGAVLPVDGGYTAL